MTLYDQIADRLVKAREAAGKSQLDAAKYLGVTYQAVSNWERSRTKIDSVSLLKLLSFYDVDPTEFMSSCGLAREAEKSELSADALEVAEAYMQLNSSEKNMIRKSLGLDSL